LSANESEDTRFDAVEHKILRKSDRGAVHMRRVAQVVAVVMAFVFAVCERTIAEQEGSNREPLTERRLRETAEAAGFRVLDIRTDIPVSIRSHLPFFTIDYNDQRLRGLLVKFQLQKIVEAAKDEWTAQLLLREWVHRSIPNGSPKSDVTHADDILDKAARGETFWCTHYAITYVECALALGWQARRIAVDRKHGLEEGASSVHHGVAEIWSNRFRKWAVVDAQSNLHFEKKGVPLSAWEIRAEWLKNQGADVDHVVGVAPNASRKNPAIVWWQRSEDETSAYFWLYLENRAVGNEEGEFSRLILPSDEANRSAIWYQNDESAVGSQIHMGYRKNLFVPTSRIDDVYWTVGVVEAAPVDASGGMIWFNLDSYCPNRLGYEFSTDAGIWKPVEDEQKLKWALKPGWNSLRLRTLSQGQITGPPMTLLLCLEKAK
jgi:hypothetical protein